MRKTVAGLLTMVMVLAMGMTAFAAESPKTESNEVTSPTENVTVYTAPKQTVEAAEAAVAAELGTAGAKTDDIVAVVDVTYDGEIPEGGVQITLNLAGVKKGDNIVLLHQRKDNGQWERITPDVVGDGYVMATFTNLSPVAVVKLPPAAPKQDEDSNQTATSSTTSTTTTKTTTTTNVVRSTTPGTSPRTGAELPILPVLAVICVAGIAVCGSKVKFNA